MQKPSSGQKSKHENEEHRTNNKNADVFVASNSSHTKSKSKETQFENVSMFNVRLARIGLLHVLDINRYQTQHTHTQQYIRECVCCSSSTLCAVSILYVFHFVRSLFVFIFFYFVPFVCCAEDPRRQSTQRMNVEK